MIEEDTRLYLLFSFMFEQIPKEPYQIDPVSHRQIRDYDHMLQVLNYLVTTAPAWRDVSRELDLLLCP
jgi:phosphatidylserine decarboxylase